MPCAGSKLAVSGFVRSSLQALTIGAHFYDQAGEISNTAQTFTLPASWALHNLQATLNGHLFDVPAGTDHAIVCWSLTAPDGTDENHMLDGMAASCFTPSP